MWRLLNSQYNLTVTQETVRFCLRAIDSVGVESRRRHRLHRRSYFNSGPNYLIHIDGYDKLKSYGIAIHGDIDGYSRRILWLKAGPSNNNPTYIANFYLNFVKESRRIPRVVRADAGTKNVIVRDLQLALRFDHGDAMSELRSFSTGRSTEINVLKGYGEIFRKASRLSGGINSRTCVMLTFLVPPNHFISSVSDTVFFR
ncbi:unnamed protein product [Mytilus coruscus]|uniref:Integrase core domain-containing protein n=1 Tax=Mytilus coruscus TaxID=42192 RepID=A0A6J8ABX0_MYTCO|nr:unnamed protein product [Mytilus coruscus]